MNNFKGSVFMTLAMFAFTLEDFFLKKATQFVPLGEILIICGLLGVVFFLGSSLIAKQNMIYKESLSLILIVRSIFEISGRVFYALAIALMPITNASAILQATPLVVVLGAVIFLREKVGWRRWGAIFFGFFGVLLVIQPGSDGFSIFSIFAVLGMIGFAGRDLATRMSPINMSNFQLGTFGFLMVFISGILITLFNLFIFPSKTVWVTISLQNWGFILANGVAGIIAYQCLTIAMRNGDISFVTPFRYVRVLFALFFGVILLGEEPNTLVLCGSLIVVLSGIYIILRRKNVEINNG
ncbi:DMT family transporter [Alphaproteobacteria bacterium]|jgi:drug/metabolite transporter (DMT)-like permease|nr:DMT family transporter [Alphaproteobacteria bacterium]MDC0461647.1 DMT family transporter [Alphaproteobacteria bacterium]